MRNTSTARARSRLLAPVLAAAFALAALFGCAAPAVGNTAAPAHHATAAAQPSCGDTAGYRDVDLSALPKEASDTVDLIKQGGPYPYPEDGTVFGNREKLLPNCDSGYYHEFTVQTPGSDDRGTRRIVTGSNGEYFYTDDHYESFSLVDVNA